MVLRSKIITVSDEPELIDLESSDEETIDDTRVEVINLDESEIAGDEQSSEDKSPPDINSVESHSDVSPLQRKGISSKSPSPCTSSSDDSKGIVKEITDIVILNDFDVDDSVRQQSEDQSIVNISTLDDSVYVVNDSTMEKSSMESSLSDTDTGKVLTISNKQAKKRKLESEMLKVIEVVELLDDDIIVLDDSIQIPTPEKDSNVILTETVAKWNSWRRLHDTENLTGAVCTSSRSNSPDPPLSDTNESCESRKVTGIIENESGESEIDKSQITNPPKKKSKLAYHRPAHLVTPLTKPAPDIPCTKTDTVSNIYNPNAGSAEKRTGLRPIVVDGNNVGISHGKGTFSLNGIKICVNFFEKRGHRQIKVFVPQYRKNRNTHDDLQKMERNGLVVITPSRKVNGKVIASYDDRYIVQYAAEFGGVIVSTDNYRDLMDENPNWKDTIESRLLMFTWVDDLLMFPQDPLGRNGPSLDDFLKFPDS